MIFRISIIFLIFLLFASGADARDMTITIIYNNISHNKELSTAWGMSCLVEGYDKTILFDTGGDGSVLLSNMKTLDIDPERIDTIVISHDHWDHTGGLWDFLEINPNVTVYLLTSFPKNFKARLKTLGAQPEEVKDATRICSGVYSTGQLGHLIPEQALVLKTAEGLVVVTGCSHPGIVEIAEKAFRTFNDKIHLITGGFHLKGSSDKEIDSIIKDLKNLGVERIGPSHCTGERAIERFEGAWGENFIDGGCGEKIEISLEK